MTSRQTFAGCALALTVGLAFRLAMASALHAPWGDNGATILELARNLTEGKGFTTQRVWTFYGPVKPFGQPEGNRQPLLPLLEAAVRLVAGDSFRAAQAVPLLVGLVVIVLSWRLGARLGGPRAGVLAAWFAALDPPQVYFSAQIEDQILFGALFLGLVLWVVNADASPRSGPWAPGILLALLYLTRTNGLLIAASYLGVMAWRRRVRHALEACLVALVCVSPWLLRNTKAFGNPFHTDNAYFLWTDGFWPVFSLRDSPPRMLPYLLGHSPLELAARWIKGAYLSLEGFLVGNIFRNEPFARDSLILPLGAALFGFRRHGRALLFAFVAFLLHFLTVSWHAHGTYRYYLPFYALINVGAGVGLAEAWERWGSRARHKTALVGAGVAVFVLPLVRPMVHTLSQGDGPVHREAMEVVRWIEASTAPDAPLMAFPIVEKYLSLYARPTVMTPYGPPEDVWRVACAYGVDYLVVSAELLRWLPALREYWITDGPVVLERRAVPSLECEMVSSGGMFRVYRIDRATLCLPAEGP